MTASCTCGDRAAWAVAELVAAGWEQTAASLVVYLTDAPAYGDPWAVWKAWVTREVGEKFAPLREAVGLP